MNVCNNIPMMHDAVRKALIVSIYEYVYFYDNLGVVEEFQILYS